MRALLTNMYNRTDRRPSLGVVARRAGRPALLHGAVLRVGVLDHGRPRVACHEVAAVLASDTIGAATVKTTIGRLKKVNQDTKD